MFACGKVKNTSQKQSLILSLHLARKLVPYGLLYINISSVSPSNKYIQLLFQCNSNSRTTTTQYFFFRFVQNAIYPPSFVSYLSQFRVSSAIHRTIRKGTQFGAVVLVRIRNQCIATKNKSVYTRGLVKLIYSFNPPHENVPVVFTRS